MKKFVTDMMYRYLSYRKYKKYLREYREMMRINGISTKPRSGEEAFLRKWKPLCRRINTDHYRLFAAYTGDDPALLTEDICCNIVEPLLNPMRMTPYYADKNTADRIFPSGSMPRTLLRRINGAYFDGRYRPIPADALTDERLSGLISCEERLIVKPSAGTDSGVGIRLFEKRPDAGFVDVKEGDRLSVDLLKQKYGNDWIVQECMTQSEFMARFNPTSVNTLRLLVYRSVKTDRAHCVNACLRIGSAGSICDNSHMGGAAVGVSATGLLGKYLIDSKGVKRTVWNGIDFADSEFTIPDFKRIRAFAESVGDCIPHHRCLNLDVMIDRAGSPRLIEVNYSSMGLWLYQFTNGACFGKFTDEIIEYCIANKHKLYRSIHLELK